MKGGDMMGDQCLTKENPTVQIDAITDDIFAMSNQLFDLTRKVESFLVGPADDVAPKGSQKGEEKDSAIPWMYKHKDNLRSIKELLDRIDYRLNHVNEVVQ